MVMHSLLLQPPAALLLNLQKNTRLNRLTTRGIDILKLIARGMTNSEIARKLFIGKATVRTHFSNLLGKLVFRDSD